MLFIRKDLPPEKRHPTCKPARANTSSESGTTSHALFFSECDNYVDGGVICSNPTEDALMAIQSFFCQQGKKLPIALVISIGTGIYPDRELGSIDLFLGVQALTYVKQREQNLISLLEEAVRYRSILFFCTLSCSKLSSYGGWCYGAAMKLEWQYESPEVCVGGWVGVSAWQWVCIIHVGNMCISVAMIMLC